jgi:parallel beta helix pectate lyase-like protein
MMFFVVQVALFSEGGPSLTPAASIPSIAAATSEPAFQSDGQNVGVQGVNDVSLVNGELAGRIGTAIYAFGQGVDLNQGVGHVVVAAFGAVVEAVVAAPTPTPTATLTPTQPPMPDPTLPRRPTPTPTPTPDPTPPPTPDPTPPPTPDPTPPPTPDPTPPLTATVAPPPALPDSTCAATVAGVTAAAVHAARDAAGTGTVCFPAGTYSGDLVASVAGQTWRLDPNATLTGAIEVSGNGVTISGGGSQRGTGDEWSAGVQVTADDVTVEAMRFVSGGQGVAIFGRDRTTIRSSDFRGLSGSALAIWGHNLGADDTLFEGNTIVQTLGNHVSPIMGRGDEGVNPCPLVNRRTIIRNNTMDQANQTIGWFGIEFKCHEDGVIEGNDLRGGHVLVSLPDNNRMIVRSNLFHMESSAFWGVEIAKAHDITVTHNRFTGSGPTFDDAVETNSDSLRAIVTWNHVSNVKAVAIGSGLTVTDNCIVNIGMVVEAFGPVTEARNTPTACG